MLEGPELGEARSPSHLPACTYKYLWPPHPLTATVNTRVPVLGGAWSVLGTEDVPWRS